MARTKKEAPEAVEIPTLGAFVALHEAAALKSGLVVTKIIHPDASGNVYAGIYAGIATKAGETSAIYSDGSQH